MAELVAELLYAGRTLAEVASLDDRQLHWVLCRKRDEMGKLVRSNGLPTGVEVDSAGMRIIRKPRPFALMFQEVQNYRGSTRDAAEQAWALYQATNPKLGQGGA